MSISIRAPRLPRARLWHIIAIAFFMNFLSQLDRGNLGFAFPYMQKALNMDATIAGLAGSIFFIGYFLLQIPSGKLAEKWSAKRIVIVAAILWGLIVMCTGLVQNAGQLLTLRFVLGLAESAQVPALVILLARWFSSRERGRAMALFALSTPVSSAVASILSGWIIGATGHWQAMFYIEGALPFIGVILVGVFMKDRPADATWLSTQEREYLEDGLAADRAAAIPKPATLLSALKSRVIIQLVVIYFLLQFGQYGFSLWLPTIVGDLTHGNAYEVGAITALPWIAAAIGLIVTGSHSDRNGDRKFHIGITVTIGAIFLLISTLIGASAVVLSMIALIIAVGFFQGYLGVFYALVPQAVAPAAVGVVMGLVNSVGTLGGGFAGPFVIGALNDATGNTTVGEMVLVGVLLVGAVLTMFLPRVAGRVEQDLAPQAVRTKVGDGS
ncbi:MAG TPA: MFS transporter [Lacisediminihabitans sp.]|uniref:MFS transporter n=1 Tax=Lacisediminihabitans sp. TaxID=2787631 RepID=UPI002EDA8FDA